MILTSFNFIYENKNGEFTKLRFDHTFDYLRLKSIQTLEDENHSSTATVLLKLLDLL